MKYATVSLIIALSFMVPHLSIARAHAPTTTKTVSARFQDANTDEEQIRKVVTESQFKETLVIYVNPTSFDRELLIKYWVPELKGGKAIINVENAVRRLIDHKWHYANESANEQFDIRSIHIFPPGDVAEVRTQERWYVPTVDDEGKLVKDRDSTLEYAVRYTLFRIDGKWLLQKCSTPYRDKD